MRCHRAKKIEERMAEFVLGPLRDAEVLREEAERQAQGERPLPDVTGSESFVLRPIYAPDDA
jgi:hypothetical protein